MANQLVRAISPIRHNGVLRVPGQTVGDNAQDFVVSDAQADRLIKAGLATLLGPAVVRVNADQIASDKPSKAYRVFLPCDDGYGLAINRLGGPNNAFAGEGCTTMWANRGSITSTATTTADGSIHLNNRAIDVFWEQERWGVLAFEIKGAPPASPTRIMGNSSSNADTGWAIVANANGKLELRAADWAWNQTGGESINVALDGQWSTVFVLLDSTKQAITMWVNGGKQTGISLFGRNPQGGKATKDFTFGNAGGATNATASLQFRNIHYLSGLGLPPQNYRQAVEWFRLYPNRPIPETVLSGTEGDSAAALHKVPVTTTATAATKALFSFLRNQVGRGRYLVGQTDGFDGWKFSPNSYDTINKFKQLTGGYGPGLAEFEYVDINQPADAADPLGDVPGSIKQKSLREAMDQHVAAGGIIALVDHPGNPTTGSLELYPAFQVQSGQHPDYGKGAWWTTGGAAQVKSGGSRYTQYTAYLDRLAAFFKSLPYPVIWRPLHEANGNWFWWQGGTTTDADYIAVWRETIDYLKAAGVTNVLYAWCVTVSANAASPQSNVVKAYSTRYPGDGYVDIVGADYYAEEQYQPQNAMGFVRSVLIDNWNALRAIAAVDGKPLAIMEFGYQSSVLNPVYNDPFLWEVVDGQLMAEFPDCSYLNYWLPDGYFGPTLGTVSAASMKRAYQSGRMLTLERLQPLSVYG